MSADADPSGAFVTKPWFVRSEQEAGDFFDALRRQFVAHFPATRERTGCGIAYVLPRSPGTHFFGKLEQTHATSLQAVLTAPANAYLRTNWNRCVFDPAPTTVPATVDSTLARWTRVPLPWKTRSRRGRGPRRRQWPGCTTSRC